MSWGLCQLDSVTWFNIISITCHPAPCYLNSCNLFLILSDQYCNPERDSNLGPKHLSLLEFEAWQLRPRGHQIRFQFFLIRSFSDGKLLLEQWMEDDHPEFVRTEHVLTDLQYLMSVPPPSGEFSKQMLKNLLTGAEKFLRILGCIQVTFQIFFSCWTSGHLKQFKSALILRLTFFSVNTKSIFFNFSTTYHSGNLRGQK